MTIVALAARLFNKVHERGRLLHGSYTEGTAMPVSSPTIDSTQRDVRPRPNGKDHSSVRDAVPNDEAHASLGDVAVLAGVDGTAECTRVRSFSRATKAYKVQAGKPVPGDTPGVFQGTAHRVSLNASTALTKLASGFHKFGSKDVIVCGSMATLGDALTLTTKDRLADTPGAIARTKNEFVYAPGHPALVLLDVDTKDIPSGHQDRVEAAGGVLAVLASVAPEFAHAGVLERPSVSSGIRAKATGTTTTGGGLHLYLIAKDGGDVPRFVAALHKRLILAGWGWLFISKAGVPFVRSLIDTAASGDPCRLVYEADAVLSDTDLEHVPGARACRVHRDGMLFDTTTVADLAVDEVVRFTTEEARLKAEGQSEIDRVRGEAVARREAEYVARGMPAGEAHARTSRSIENQTLDSAAVLHLDDGRTPTVADVLRDPAAFDGRARTRWNRIIAVGRTLPSSV
jgi:hypothetical protein